jgi:glycosyltransferase involved in cell wall biosynthesis
MTKLRVALVTWYPRDPTRPRGGVEAVSVTLARALAAHPELEVHVITVDDQALAPTKQDVAGMTLHVLPRGTQPLLAFAAGPGRRMIQAYLNELAPDVVHAHDTFGIMTQGLSLPRVFTIHGFIHEDTRYKGGLRAKARAWLWQRIEERTWAEQPNIVAISPYVRERLRGIARGVIHDIENPIAPECFAVRRQEAAGTIFSAAVINRRKNTLGLVQAFAELKVPGARLRLAGPVTEADYGERIQHAIQAAGLTGSVDLLGSIPTAEIRQELSRASVFALVSFEEGAPMGVAEALAAGVPVVTSNRCGMPYMLRHG